MDFISKVIHIINQFIDNDSIQNDQIENSFSSLNLDSITFIKLIVALEGEFDFEFDDEMLLFTAFPTIRTMIEYVECKANTNCEIT